MKCRIKVEMDNAAFCDGNSGYELARILREFARAVNMNDWHDLLSIKGSDFGCEENDSNGNPIATLTIRNS